MAKEKKKQKAGRTPVTGSAAKKNSQLIKPGNSSSKWSINKQFILLAGLISVLTFIALSPLLNNGFTNWDDTKYVTENPLLKNISFDGIKAIFNTPVSSNYHPITILSLTLNYQISGLNPFSYLLTNLLFHIFNTLLVFYFIYHLSGKRIMLALFVSLLFGIHPMHVESVAWVSERKDVLYTFFLLLGLITYMNYLKRPTVMKYMGLLLLFVLSLLSKPAAVIFPVLLILIDYYQYKKAAIKRLILEKVPFFILAFILGVATFQIQSAEAISMERFSFPERILFGCYGFVMYIIKLFFPIQLSALHPFPENGQFGLFYYLAPFITLVIICLVFYFRKNRVLIFGMGFYFISILLVLQFISVGNAVIAERYSYLSYIGLLFITGNYYDKAIKKKTRLPGGKNILYVIFAGIVILFMVITFQRTKVWNNPETLWTDVIRKYPDSYRAYMSRGRYYVVNEKYDLALPDLTRSLKINPAFAHALELRGITYNKLKRYDLALIDLEKWKNYEPYNADAYIQIGIALSALDRPDEALSSFNQAITLNSNNSKAFLNRGTIYFNKKKDYQSALKDFNQAIALEPNYGMAYFNRANCYLVLGDKVKAMENANKAKQLGVNIPAKFFDKLK